MTEDTLLGWMLYSNWYNERDPGDTMLDLRVFTFEEAQRRADEVNSHYPAPWAPVLPVAVILPANRRSSLEEECPFDCDSCRE